MEKVIGLYGETIKVPCNNGDNKPSDLMFTKWKHVSLCCSSCLNLSVLDHWCPAVRCQGKPATLVKCEEMNKWFTQTCYLHCHTHKRAAKMLGFLLAVSLFCWKSMMSQLRTGAVKECSVWQICNSAFVLLSLVAWERHFRRYLGEAGTKGWSKDHSHRQL